MTTLSEGVATNVYPSGFDFIAASMPMAPEAPPLLSMTNCWPTARDRRSAKGRVALSEPPPGAKLTTIRTGLVGQLVSCACALALPAASSAAEPDPQISSRREMDGMAA